MTALQSSPTPDAAAAAVRRLGSSRPLYAVSLHAALSQLVQFSATFAGKHCSEPSSGSCVPRVPPAARDTRPNASEATSLPIQSTLAQERAVGSLDVAEQAAPTRVWLTRQFVAQVRAHFQAALQEASVAHYSSTDPASDLGECTEEEQQAREYAEALSRAALHWGLLLLLAAEPSLLVRGKTQELKLRYPPHEAHCSEAAVKCLQAAEEASRADTSNWNAIREPATPESADVILRGEHTINKAFELSVQ